MLSPMGFLLWMALLLVVVEVFVKHRVARQYSLLWLLTVAAERLIPLIPAIEAFAQEQWGGFALRARRLAAMLTAGVPLPATASSSTRWAAPCGARPDCSPRTCCRSFAWGMNRARWRPLCAGPPPPVTPGARYGSRWQEDWFTFSG